MPILALMDCNNFYASCERVFQPRLTHTPIVVLSNNDGCIIARSNEAKALGIPMGEPYFKAKHIIEHHNVAVFSSNYTLYGDMSRRVMRSVVEFVSPDDMEVYSIDEAFIDLTHHNNPEALARTICQKVKQWTGIPVSIGIGHTKTLAKAANHVAKKYKAYGGVFYIDSEERREKVLQAMPIGDVWGIGRNHEKRLKSYGIHNAYDFTQKQDSWVRKHMHVVGLKTMQELKGTACAGLDFIPKPKKMIIVSRSFGRKIADKRSVQEALANFIERAAEKLRQEKQLSCACVITLRNELFSKEERFRDKAYVAFPHPTDSTLDIMHYAMQGFEHAYRDGQTYKKCGIALFDMLDKAHFTQDLFDTRNLKRSDSLMKAFDTLNATMGANTLTLGASHGNGHWIAKKDSKSRCYTTRWDELVGVR